MTQTDQHPMEQLTWARTTKLRPKRCKQLLARPLRISASVRLKGDMSALALRTAGRSRRPVRDGGQRDIDRDLG